MSAFDHRDLTLLNLLLRQARSVVAMLDVHHGNTGPDVIGLRHDVDDNEHAFETAQKLARWEARHGYRSTFFVLHTAGYWSDEPFFRAGLEEIAVHGHEIGIHVNALAAALRVGRDPHEILWAALEELRDWGFSVRGAASHGDGVCYDAQFVNYEQFTDCARDDVDPTRTLTFCGRELRIEPVPLATFGLDYETYHLPRGYYLSDSGAEWNQPFDDMIIDFAGLEGQLHMLVHPDWWAGAFRAEEVVVA